jgi:hypothetical protein
MAQGSGSLCERLLQRGLLGPLLTLLAISAAVTGCSGSVVSSDGGAGSSGSAGSSSAGPTAAEFPGQIAKSFCASLGPCCASAALRFDDAACETFIAHNFAIDSVLGNGLAFDSAAAQRCIDNLLTETMGCTANLKYDLSDCDQLVVGTLPVGASCTDGRACAAPPGGTAGCTLDASGVRGMCELEMPPLTRGINGDACSASCTEGDGCAFANGAPMLNVACYNTDGLYCSAELTCAALLAAGQRCRSTADCAAGLYCAEDSSNVPGVIGSCALLKDNGTPCLTAAECVSHACNSTCFHPPLATPNLCLGIPDPPTG